MDEPQQLVVVTALEGSDSVFKFSWKQDTLSSTGRGHCGQIGLELCWKW
jgi:hypothetical protein